MAFSVRYSEQAADDLEEILTYIKDVLFSSQAAYSFYKAVEKKLVQLSDNPYIYPLHHDDTLRQKGFRFTAAGNYLLFYTINDDDSSVNIVRILYGKRDLPSAFI